MIQATQSLGIPLMLLASNGWVLLAKWRLDKWWSPVTMQIPLQKKDMRSIDVLMSNDTLSDVPSLLHGWSFRDKIDKFYRRCIIDCVSFLLAKNMVK